MIEAAPEPLEFELPIGDVNVADFVGAERHRYVVKNDLPEDFGASRDNSLQRHTLGARCEFAVARYLNVYTSSMIGLSTEADVGFFADVRGTERRGFACLIIHHHINPRTGIQYDPDDRPFVFVRHLIETPRFLFVGWQYGKTAKKDCYWRKDVRSPAFFVPPQGLRDVRQLLAIEAKRRRIEC